MRSEPNSGIPNISWGPKPAVVSLYNPAREAQVPEELRSLDAALKGHRGLCVGRENELNQMRSYFEVEQEKRNRGELTGNDCLGMLVTNAPGAGKTTVLEEFAMRQSLEGITCIQLAPDHLHHQDWFTEALKGYAASVATETESNLQSLLGALRQTAEINPTTPLAATAIASGTAGAVLAAMGHVAPVAGGVAAAVGGAVQFVTSVYQQVRQRRKELNEKLEANAPRSPKEALITLDTLLEGKYLFIIDECQDWLDAKDRLETVKANIRLVTDPGLRRSQGREGGGTVFAGLGDATDALDGLRLTRARVIWLDELDRDAATMIIAREIGLANIAAERKQQIANQWMTQLTDDFSHWAQHCAAAGRIARKVLEATESKGPHDPQHEAERLEWVRTLTAKQVITLYDDRWGVAVGSDRERACRAVVAAANRLDNEIPNDTVSAAVQHGRERLVKGQPIDQVKADTEHALSRMKRAGVIRAVTDVEATGQRRIRHWEMPLPSLRRYITENMNEAELELAYRDADNGIRDTVAEYILKQAKAEQTNTTATKTDPTATASSDPKPKNDTQD